MVLDGHYDYYKSISAPRHVDSLDQTNRLKQTWTWYLSDTTVSGNEATMHVVVSQQMKTRSGS